MIFIMKEHTEHVSFSTDYQAIVVRYDLILMQFMNVFYCQVWKQFALAELQSLKVGYHITLR